MTILGIENRSENWKTALHFSPLFGGNGVRLIERLGESPRPRPDDVNLELFWKGMRDFLYQEVTKKESARDELVDIYTRLFPGLRRDVENFGDFQDLRAHNYDVSTDERTINIVNNFANTEIDVVLETPKYLFIGEAKHVVSFGANSDHVLVHQLIRQYVMATILIEFTGKKKKVIPFVICDKVDSTMKTTQVRFMIDRGWLKEDNVLGWGEVNPSAS
jgi:hypothetical protein